MTRQAGISAENNFSGGLKTEFTVLNFPENACTDTDNCVFDMTGEVSRRFGMDVESSYLNTTIDRTNKAITSYKWNNAGGDGTSKLYVLQIGYLLYFYLTSSAAQGALSRQIGGGTIDLRAFASSGSVTTAQIEQTECEYADGNGYLIVFHPYVDPFYCTFSSGLITPNRITVKIRDTVGIPENGVPDTLRPASLTNEHKYNLINQGWTAGTLWSASSLTDQTVGTGSFSWTVAAGIVGIVGGQAMAAVWNDNFGHSIYMSGTMTSYAGTTLTCNITSANVPGYFVAATASGIPWSIYPINISYINDWFTALSSYPSNSDQWWRFKNSSGNFDPATTINRVTVNTGPAPKGAMIIDAFNQLRSTVSGVPSITNVTTTIRPRTGTWFAGRVWYAGTDASQADTGDMPFSSWTESIYFSQIVTKTDNFGQCYQINDPTSEDLFDLLPSDGGVIVIQGCGSVYKLFPIQNGLLVFASNGIWFITGSQGIGFTANDYTITKIANVQSISSTSFVNVQGYPVFWNEEGIYTVTPGQQGGLTASNLCLGTILSFYADIPYNNKLYARGDYDPVNYTINWVFRSTASTSITERYEFDRVLIFNTSNKAFYPWTFSQSTANHNVHDVKYIPGTPNAPNGTFKYIGSYSTNVTFYETNSATYKDWFTYNSAGVNYVSTFTTGYKLHGNAIRKWQPTYVYIFTRADDVTSYNIQGLWEFANSGDSGKFSTSQNVLIALSHFGNVYRRYRIRGHGLSLQFKVDSEDGYPFNIAGWTVWESKRAGV